MNKFSDTYGYTKSCNVIVKEEISREIRNSILNWLGLLSDMLNDTKSSSYYLDKYIWLYFLDEDLDQFEYGKTHSARIIISGDFKWYEKLNLIEFILDYLVKNKLFDNDQMTSNVQFLNNEFERHNFAYRIIDNRIVEINDACEVSR